MPSNAVPGFRPSTNGFRFPNAFPPGPMLRVGPVAPRVLGFANAANGLCGGMTLTVRDLYERRVPVPADGTPPPNGSAQFQAIVRRQIQSLDWLRVPLRYYDLQAFRPDPPAGVPALLRREPPRVVAVRDEWPPIRAEIDAGHPAVVGLIRAAGISPWTLRLHHQVLAYAYDEEGPSLRISIYDSNHPGDDEVELRANLDDDAGRPWRERIRLAQSTGEPLLGFFRQPYPPPRSLGAWRSS